MNQWTEFENLKQATGLAYQQQRDFILQTTPDIKLRLKDYHTHQDWHYRILARILEGWTDHQQLYRQVLAELDAVDVQREGRTAAGITPVWRRFALKAKNEYQHKILPLCWEVLLKYDNVWPDWKLTTFLYMVSTVPDGSSVKPVLFFMENADNYGFIDLGGNILQQLPVNVAQKAVEEHLKIAEQNARSSSIIEVKTRDLRSVLKDTLDRIKNP